MRVVSLLPSATEIVCALGAADQLVGISHECDFPAEVAGRPVVTRSRIALGASSGDIDRAVRAALLDALSIYAVDAELLARLAPDVIITQDLCEVCAVSLDDVRSAVARAAHDRRAEIVSLRPVRLVDVLDDVIRVAAALERPDAGEAVRAALSRRIAAIAETARARSDRPRVATIEWLDPLMLGGTWMPDLVELAGGVAIGVTPGAPAPTITPAELRALEPDVVVLKPCGFALDRTLAERALIDDRVLAHVGPATRVYASDGSAYFNRPGPRLVESLEIMAACIDPATFAELAAAHAGALVRLR
jgi:iron complex transport system substrate-binding protein